MGYIFLLLFGAALFGLYIAVRRAWAQTLYLGSIAGILNMLFVVLFALIQEETSTGQAIFSGVVVGVGFTLVVVIVAVFFRTNQPGAHVQMISQADQQRSTPTAPAAAAPTDRDAAPTSGAPESTAPQRPPDT